MIALPPAPPGCHWVPVVARSVTRSVRRFVHVVVRPHHVVPHVTHHAVRRAPSVGFRLVCRAAAAGAAIGGAVIPVPYGGAGPEAFGPAPFEQGPQQFAGGGVPENVGGFPGGGFGGASGAGGSASDTSPLVWPNAVGGLVSPGQIGLPTIPLLEDHGFMPRLLETPAPLVAPVPVHLTEMVPPIPSLHSFPPPGPVEHVPEPSTFAVVLIGLSGTVLCRAIVRART